MNLVVGERQNPLYKPPKDWRYRLQKPMQAVQRRAKRWFKR